MGPFVRWAVFFCGNIEIARPMTSCCTLDRVLLAAVASGGVTVMVVSLWTPSVIADESGQDRKRLGIDSLTDSASL